MVGVPTQICHTRRRLVLLASPSAFEPGKRAFETIEDFEGDRAMSQPQVGVLMGSKSDWETMRHCVETLERFGVSCEVRVCSAHRTPDAAFEYAATAAARGLSVLIAAAGGAAHLAGVLAAKTTLPVLAVPMKSDALQGLDSLLSMVQMPAGVPVATFAIGKAGAVNAALFAIAILAQSEPSYRTKLEAFRAEQAAKILNNPDPRT